MDNATNNIWEKCNQYNAVPFFGFPLIISYKNGAIIWEFPEGIDKIDNVAEKVRQFVGGSLIEITGNKIRILPSEKHLAVIIYQAFVSNNKSIKTK